jgi:hypothetical protein
VSSFASARGLPVRIGPAVRLEVSIDSTLRPARIGNYTREEGKSLLISFHRFFFTCSSALPSISAFSE